MKSSTYSQKTMLLFSVILIVIPFLVVKLNMFSRNLIYSGVIHDALGMGTVDLVELRAEGKTTYTDKDGKFSLLVKRLLLWDKQKSANDLSIEVLPTFDFEGNIIKVPCTLVAVSVISAQADCSTLVYPTVSTVADRVLATEKGQGLFVASEISARKSSLWDLLSEDSQQVWKNRDRFVNSLVLQEMIGVKLKLQPMSFSVSRIPKFVSEFNYLNRRTIKGELASVDVSVMNASGNINKTSLYFIKKDNIWRYLTPDTPEAIDSFNSKNSWVLNEK